METPDNIEEGKENIFNRLIAFTYKTEGVLEHAKLTEKLQKHSLSIFFFFQNEHSGKQHPNPTAQLMKILDDGIKKFSSKPMLNSPVKEEKYQQRLLYVNLLNEMKKTLSQEKGFNKLSEQYFAIKWKGAGSLNDAVNLGAERKRQQK